jgi:hypothetical protein
MADTMYYGKQQESQCQSMIPPLNPTDARSRSHLAATYSIFLWKGRPYSESPLGGRSFLKIAAAVGGASTVGVLPNLAGTQDIPQQTDTPAITLQDVPFSSGAKLTVERRGQIVLFGINRPYIQNRIDPETFEKLAEAYYHLQGWASPGSQVLGP